MVGGRLPRSKYGYVGLQNQGATCYMNSLMQQLFLIPRFRQGILLGTPLSHVARWRVRRG
jgi:ubiquitin C-terminal hydrolase